jgi:hypothetical protein
MLEIQKPEVRLSSTVGQAILRKEEWSGLLVVRSHVKCGPLVG